MGETLKSKCRRKRFRLYTLDTNERAIRFKLHNIPSKY